MERQTLKDVLGRADTQGRFLITLLRCACLPDPPHHVSTAPPPHRDTNFFFSSKQPFLTIREPSRRGVAGISKKTLWPTSESAALAKTLLFSTFTQPSALHGVDNLFTIILLKINSWCLLLITIEIVFTISCSRTAEDQSGLILPWCHSLCLYQDVEEPEGEFSLTDFDEDNWCCNVLVFASTTSRQPRLILFQRTRSRWLKYKIILLSQCVRNQTDVKWLNYYIKHI